MTLPPFVDGNILYAAELNQLRLDLKADATSKDNALALVLRGEIDEAVDNLVPRLEALETATRNSGVRNINALVSDRASGEGRLQRVGSAVVLTISDLRLSTLTTGRILQLPIGFRPSTTTRVAATRYWSHNAASAVQVSTNGDVVISSFSPVPNGSSLAAQVTFMTADAWPSTLPGTPD